MGGDHASASPAAPSPSLTLLRGLRPEAELLLCCARTCPDAATVARAGALMRKAIDWDYLLRLARRHRVTALVGRQLEAIDGQAVPETVRSELAAHFESNKQRNLFMTAQLSHVLKLLEANGVRAISYKGPALAATAYGSLALREFDDLDLLVSRQDVLRVKGLLMAEGYRPKPKLTEAQERWLLDSQHAYVLVRDGGPVFVELHWTISPRYVSRILDPERLWDRVERVTVAGVVVPTLHPEVLLPSLSEHGAKHAWERLAWICDIAELARSRTALDWDDILRQAHRHGGGRTLALGLLLARSLLGAPVPDDVRRRVESDRAVEPLAAEVRGRLFQPIQRPAGVLGSALFQLRLLEHWGKRMRFCRLALTSPTVADWQRVRLPRALSFLYYPLRAVRLFVGARHTH
jgi:hypothetical protein